MNPTTIQPTSTSNRAPSVVADGISYISRRPGPEERLVRLVVAPRFDAEFQEIEDGIWVVTDRETGIFGHGDGPNEAVADFLSAVKEHLDVLRAQAELSPELQFQLSYLEARIS